jgi:hypothetical protein
VKRAIGSARSVVTPAPTATHVVNFEQRPKQTPRTVLTAPGANVPRIAQLLALAHHIHGMIQSAEIRDWAEAARLAGITRARMTQIANLLLLSPEIQDAVLVFPQVPAGRDRITERHLRTLIRRADWRNQRCEWAALSSGLSGDRPDARFMGR